MLSGIQENSITARTLEINNITLNMNILPHEPLSSHDHPETIRTGVQDMTQFGMGEEQMVRIAELIKECIIEKRLVKEEVNWFSSGYQEVKYSFDELVRRKLALVEVKAT